MGWILGLAFYFIIWWTLLFAILPFGVRSQQEMNNVVPGSEPAKLIETKTDLPDDINVASFVAPADIIGLTDRSLAQDQSESPCMIVDKEPIPYIVAAAVDW